MMPSAYALVQVCEVGDPARGGVVKDYRVTMGEAA